MAIYHYSMKAINRSSGRSSVAAAAYRSGQKLQDERTGETYDYERRTGVIHTEIFLPCGKIEREELWNLAEMTEKRRDAKVAREIVVALPHELNQEQQIQLVQDYAQSLSYRTGWGIDVAVHAPGRDGDNRNTHAHMLCTTRRMDWGEGGKYALGAKTRDWDVMTTGKNLIALERWEWERLTNRALEQASQKARIDHRSYEAQGNDLLPQVHLGVHATQLERQGISTERGNYNREVQRHNAQVIELAQVRAERQEEQAWQQQLKQMEALPFKELKEKVYEQYPGGFLDYVERHQEVRQLNQRIQTLSHELHQYDEQFRYNDSYWRIYQGTEKRATVMDGLLAKTGLAPQSDMSKAQAFYKKQETWHPEAMKAITVLDKQLQEAYKQREAVQDRIQKSGAYEKVLGRFEEAQKVLDRADQREWEKELKRLETMPYAEMYQHYRDHYRERVWDKTLGDTQRAWGSHKTTSASIEATSAQDKRSGLYKECEQLSLAVTKWHREHPVKSYLHEKGIKQDKELVHLERRLEVAQKQHDRTMFVEKHLKDYHTAVNSNSSQLFKALCRDDRRELLEKRHHDVKKVLAQRQQREPEEHKKVLERSRGRGR